MFIEYVGDVIVDYDDFVYFVVLLFGEYFDCGWIVVDVYVFFVDFVDDWWLIGLYYDCCVVIDGEFDCFVVG